MTKRREVIYQTLSGDWFGFVEQRFCYFLPTFPTEAEARAAAAAVPAEMIR